ncbi:hypothetical protein NDU88_002301 [Pleurodeles waltl]|uniref:Uncharacterized protein n=1 Tax=Pleurodeles waltl TaxID=8319 RepID=A0AAV7SCB0_PLEWA|nr:hypothetical protein NDU88_002301 [Pleurodeles waltl]
MSVTEITSIASRSSHITFIFVISGALVANALRRVPNADSDLTASLRRPGRPRVLYRGREILVVVAQQRLQLCAGILGDSPRCGGRRGAKSGSHYVVQHQLQRLQVCADARETVLIAVAAAMRRAAATMCGAETAAAATAVRRCPDGSFSLRWLPQRGEQQRPSAALSSGGRGLQASPLRRHHVAHRQPEESVFHNWRLPK